MSYCINPHCPRPQNDDSLTHCEACRSSLIISEWLYKVIKPLDDQYEWKDTRLYEVIDDSQNLMVLKVLKNNSSVSVQLFEKEVEILQRVKHPGIPKLDKKFIFISSDSSELHCFTMEKIEGLNLKQWVEQNGSISEEQALEWLKQLAEILALVHKNRFLHQDIKPENIMQRLDGQIMLIDFSNVPGIISLGYTPPEQAENNAKPQSDFFALGRTFVHLMTGKHPIDLPKDTETGRLKWRIRELEVSDAFADLIDDLMAPSPEQRPQNMQVILERINKILNSQPDLSTDQRVAPLAGYWRFGVGEKILLRFGWSPNPRSNLRSSQPLVGNQESPIQSPKRNNSQSIPVLSMKVILGSLALFSIIKVIYNNIPSKYIPHEETLNLKYIDHNDMEKLCQNENYYKRKIFQQRPELQNEKNVVITPEGLKFEDDESFKKVIPAYRWKCHFKLIKLTGNDNDSSQVGFSENITIGLDMDKDICGKNNSNKVLNKATYLYYDKPDSFYCVPTK